MVPFPLPHRPRTQFSTPGRNVNSISFPLRYSHPSNNPIYGPISAPPFPRYGHSVNPVASIPGGDLYVFGGLVQNAVKNDLYILSCAPNPSSGGAGPPGGTLNVGLVETRGEIPGPRVGHASVGVGNVLIVWGGDTKSRPEDRQDDGLYLLNLSASYHNFSRCRLTEYRVSSDERMDPSNDEWTDAGRSLWTRRCDGR